MHFSSPKGRFLLLLLGSDENKAVIMPKEVAGVHGGTLSEVVGTGPYRFAEYREDQYVRLQRFADYTARDDAPNYQTGNKIAYPGPRRLLFYQTGNKIAYPDELLFRIVPEASTRVAGLEAREYLAASMLRRREGDRADHRQLGQPRAHRAFHRRAVAVSRHQRRDGAVRRTDLGGQAA